ncbi:envelope stress response membrane protein PspB [Sphingomonas arenae]|uniref:envelope stress response membrane protein PspB n=1 Tax=Sphingomonas arenae TaxID=2812555 RepID=UPI001967E235|nr:envelope stress response membrane protein PspB [Sphingomonas arenae]
METGEFLALCVTLGILFIGLPWLIFHYITKWKTAATLTSGDEKLLDDLHDLARRLDDRLCSIERIMTAENPNWRQQCLPESSRLLGTDRSLDEDLGRIRTNAPTSREYR